MAPDTEVIVFQEKIFGKYLRRMLVAWQSENVICTFVLKVIVSAHFIVSA